MTRREVDRLERVVKLINDMAKLLKESFDALTEQLCDLQLDLTDDKKQEVERLERSPSRPKTLSSS